RSGQEAVDALRAEPVDVVLTDLMMPAMSGQELLRAVRAVAPNAEVVLMTAYGTVEAAGAAMKDGADDFLTKPLKRHAVLKRVHRPGPAQGRPDRARTGRQPVPRRGRRADGFRAGEAAPVPAGWRDRASGRERHDEGGLPGGRRDESGPLRARAGRQVPRRPLLPPERDPSGAAAAARSHRGHSAARRPFHGPLRGE